MDFIQKRNKLLDEILDKMEKVFNENALIINKLSVSVNEAKKYRKEASEQSEAFSDL